MRNQHLLFDRASSSLGRLRTVAFVGCALLPLLTLSLWPAAHATPQGRPQAAAAADAAKQARGGSIEHPIARDFFDRAMRAYREAETLSGHLEDQGLNASDRRRLERSRREALREGARLLQRILDDKELRNGVLWESDTRRFIGVSPAVRRTLIEHGELALQAYRELVDSDAAHAVRRARATGDAERLAEVVLVYPFSTAALPAGIEAARVFWEAGEVDRAAALARRLLERDDLEEQQGGMLVALAAYAYGLRGEVWEAYEMRRVAEQRFPGARVATGRTTRPLSDVTAEQHARAQEQASGSTEALSWPSQASDPRGGHHGIGTVEAEDLKWRERYPDTTRSGPTENYSLNYPRFSLPRRFPAANESLLVVPNRNSVLVYNLFDERRIWRYDVPIDNRGGNHMRHREGEFWLDERLNRDPAGIDTATIADDVVYVPLETPMQYDLHDPLGVGGNRHQNRIWGTCIISFAPRRRLYSFDARTGEIRWQIGASWEDREAPIHETLSYTTAPLVLGKRVYASAAKVLDQNAHVFVVAFDRDTPENAEVADGEEAPKPKLLWETKIGSGLQETNLFGRPTREPVPSALAYQSHRLFLSTNIGTVAALDALTGEQLWSFPYDRIRFVPPVELRNHYRDLTWFNMPPVVHDGVVYVAPMDSYWLYALDAETGEELWKLPWSQRTPRDAARFLVGVHGDYLYWVGERYLFRTRLDRPYVEHFDLTRSLRTNVTGRPILVDGVLYAATSDHNIMRFDVERRRHLATVHRGLGVIGGNLALSNGVLVAANEHVFGVAYDWESLLADLQRREQERPNDPRIKLRIADIARQQGDERGRAIAIDYYQQVLDLTEGIVTVDARQAAREAHRGLLSLWMETYEQARETGNRAAQREALENAQRHVRTPEDGISLLLMRLRHAQPYNLEEALSVLDEMRDEYASFTHDFAEHGRISVEQFALVEGAQIAESLGRHGRAIELWQRALERFGRERLEGRDLAEVARQRIDELIGIAGRGAYAEIERRAEQAYQEAIGRRSATAALSVARRFPNSLVAPRALLSRARWGLERAMQDAAEPDTELLEEVVDALRRVRDEYGESESRPEALLLLARAYSARRMYHAARSAYRQLARDYGGLIIETGDESVDVTSYVESRLQDPLFARLLGEVPLASYPRTPLSLAREEIVGTDARVRLLEPAGDPGPFGDNVYMIANHRLVARNASTGDVIWENPDIITFHAACYINQRLALVSTNGLYVIEPDTGEVVEQVNLGYRVQHGGAVIRDGLAAMVMREDIRTGYRLHVGVVNVETGEVHGRLSQPFGDVFSAVPMLTGDRLIVYARGSNLVQIAGFDVRDVGEPLYFIDEFPSLPRGNPELIGEDRFVVALADGNMQIRSVRTGGLLTTHGHDGRIGSRRMWSHEGRLYYSDMRRLVALELTEAGDGEVARTIWEQSFNNDLVNHNSLPSAEAFYCVRLQSNNIRLSAHQLDTGEQLWVNTVLEGVDNERYQVQQLKLTSHHLVLYLRRTFPREDTQLHVVKLIENDTGKVVQRIEFNIEGISPAEILAYGDRLHFAYEHRWYIYRAEEE